MNILSAGAAKGLLHTIASSEAIELTGEFGAAGASCDRLSAGVPCDVIVLTTAMIAELVASGVARFVVTSENVRARLGGLRVARAVTHCAREKVQVVGREGLEPSTKGL